MSVELCQGLVEPFFFQPHPGLLVRCIRPGRNGPWLLLLYLQVGECSYPRRSLAEHQVERAEGQPASCSLGCYWSTIGQSPAAQAAQQLAEMLRCPDGPGGRATYSTP